MKRRTNRILSILLVVLSLALLAGAGFLLVQVLPQKAPQEVTSLETNSVFEKEDAVVEPEREQAYEGEIPPAAETQPEPDTQPSVDQPEQTRAFRHGPHFRRGGQARKNNTCLYDGGRKNLAAVLCYARAPYRRGNRDARGRFHEAGAWKNSPSAASSTLQRIWKAARRRRKCSTTRKPTRKSHLFLGTDEEGGTVSRVGSNPAMGAQEFPSAQSLGEQADPAAVYQAGQDIGGTLHAIGFNMDFAPVADVSSGASAVIGSRSFGTDAQLCASLVSIMMQSLSAEEIVPCLKHFPGYGSAITDDHYGTSILTKTQEELEACDFLPFSSGIASGAPFVMVSHLSVPEVVGDETPSDLSSKIVSDLLRNKLGFTGVIITDSHQMASITDHYAPGEAAVKALQAGVDMILMPQDLQAAFDGVKQALSDGTLTQARIDESVLRILQVKAEYNILQ